MRTLASDLATSTYGIKLKRKPVTGFGERTDNFINGTLLKSLIRWVKKRFDLYLI